MQELMQNLGNAINDALSDSEGIAEAIGKIRQAGYDVFLILEATIAFNKKSEDQEEPDTSDDAKTSKRTGKETPGQPPEIKLTKKDQDFLGALKISFGNNGGDDNEDEKDKTKKKK